MSRVKVTINGVPAIMCISNNSNINVLKPEIAMRAGLPIEKLKQPFLVGYGYGVGKTNLMQYEVLGVPFQSNGFIDQDDFYVTPDFTIDCCDGILGGKWFTKFSTISFKRGNIVTVTNAAGNAQELDSIPYEKDSNKPFLWIVARKLPKEGKDPLFG